MGLGVVVALEQEAVLVRRHMRLWQRRYTAVGGLWQGDLYGHEVVLLRCGMGLERAACAATWLFHAYRLWGAINVGLAGGLQASLASGDVVLAQQVRLWQESAASGTVSSAVVTPDTGLVHVAATAAAQAALVRHWGGILSVAHVVPYAAAKIRLGRCSGALAVDMESYSVGRVATEQHLPFVVLRAIFDTCEDDIPLQMDRITTPDGMLQYSLLARYLMHYPHLLMHLPFLWRKARIARHRLGIWLYHFLTLLNQKASGGHLS